ARAVADTTTLKLNGPAAESLRERGVRIAPQKPASGGQERVVLPVAAGLAGAATTLLRHRGAISLRAGKRKLRLGRLSLVLGKAPRVTAKLGGTRTDLFRVLRGGRRDVDPVAGRVVLSGLPLQLTRAAARAIAKRLSLPMGRNVVPGLTSRPIGTLAASVSGLDAPGAPDGKSPDATQQAATCPLPSGAGPAPEEPLAVSPRPLGASDIVGATIDWQVREPFIRYIGTGEGTSVSGGATADPPLLLPGASAALSYGFHFPFASGWHDAGANPADLADDGALVRFGGAVRFQYSGHGIDLTTAEPEIELAGAKSRTIFAIAESGKPAQRQVLINLDLSRAAAIRAAGNGFTYERVPGAIPAGTAASTFAGFYAPGSDFGCATVSFSTAG
ncbi:MAG: HtaA domain-containing protein, partial [Solirubrobacterales bacterium]